MSNVQSKRKNRKRVVSATSPGCVHYSKSESLGCRLSIPEKGSCSQSKIGLQWSLHFSKLRLRLWLWQVAKLYNGEPICYYHWCQTGMTTNSFWLHVHFLVLTRIFFLVRSVGLETGLTGDEGVFMRSRKALFSIPDLPFSIASGSAIGYCRWQE